jgi:ribosomal protein S17
MLFQENVLSGLVVFLILLWHSRIATSLAIFGFITGQLFNGLVHANDTEASQHLLNVNFMAGSMAIGSFFLIPSFRSYIWAVLSVPCILILMTALGKITGLLNLTSYSLPFSITTILLVYFIQMLRPSRGLVITPQQFYSPEKNLYDHINARKRLFSERYMPLQLPFIGEWIVSQGYDSDITHKGDWSKALDFVIVDSQMKTYSSYAAKPENFYCYGKPVLSPAAGYVQEIIDHIEDNEIGKINRKDNWGNTIVISHGQGLFTKMCHLRKDSFKVRVGDRVRTGEVLAACGNSGRSPEPHLHFQVQLTPYVGSKTYAYPFQSFMTRQNGLMKLLEFAVPEETQRLSQVLVNECIVNAFDFSPGFRMHASAPDFGDEHWEVFTDAYNLTYIYCHETRATAYFNRNHAFFYFTAFYGDRTGLLYLFYLSCYKVSFSTDTCCAVEDEFPLHWTHADLGKWLQDLIAPFYIFRRMMHKSDSRVIGGGVFEPIIQVTSETKLQYPRLKRIFQGAVVQIEHKKIVSIQIESQNRKTLVTCRSME